MSKLIRHTRFGDKIDCYVYAGELPNTSFTKVGNWFLKVDHESDMIRTMMYCKEDATTQVFDMPLWYFNLEDMKSLPKLGKDFYDRIGVSRYQTFQTNNSEYLRECLFNEPGVNTLEYEKAYQVFLYREFLLWGEKEPKYYDSIIVIITGTHVNEIYLSFPIHIIEMMNKI